MASIDREAAEKAKQGALSEIAQRRCPHFHKDREHHKDAWVDPQCFLSHSFLSAAVAPSH